MKSDARHVDPAAERIPGHGAARAGAHGEQWMPATAIRCRRTYVLVSWADHDPREAALLVWLRAEDVRQV